MRRNEDTIAAVSTAMAPSGIGIVRLSGPKLLGLRIGFTGLRRMERGFPEQKTHTIHYGYIVDGEVEVDEVLVMLMRGPILIRVRIR